MAKYFFFTTVFFTWVHFSGVGLRLLSFFLAPWLAFPFYDMISCSNADGGGGNG
jgi:hypothetical protein